MTPPLTSDWLHWSETRTLITLFEQAGLELRFVGGCVRDTLLGRPVTDVDIATPAAPQAVTELLTAQGIKVIPTGIAHGTVTAVVNKKPFEITTLRRDVACDGRHATIEYTDDWLEDASRRDLTINALYATPEGHVVDFFNGIEDANNRFIRFIGDANARIREDALRILRFFRFYAHYGRGAPDAEGFEACLELGHLIAGLSGERIQHEMLKLLAAKNPYYAMTLLQEAAILPEVLLHDVSVPLLMALRTLEKAQDSAPYAPRRLALLLASLAAEEGRERVLSIASRWKLSNALKAEIFSLLESYPDALAEDTGREVLRKRGEQCYLNAVLIAASLQSLTPADTVVTDAMNRLAQWRPVAFPLSGEDLRARGVAEGKPLGDLLKTLETEWVKSHYRLTREQLLARVASNE